jgi:hypothetical protein
MRKKVLPLLSVLGLFLVRQAALANDIEPGKEFYTATRAAGPLTNIVLDGSLSEWVGVTVLADPKFAICPGCEGVTACSKFCSTNGNLVLFERCDVCIPGTPDWTGPDDQTSAVQVVWDVDNVYFGFVVTDDYHENAANSAWNGDSIQLMVANAARTAEVALYNYALGGIEGAIGEVIVEHQRPVPPPGITEAAITRNATTKRTIYEIKLPASAVGLTPPLQAGMQFGLGMAINDGDELAPGQGGWGGLGAHSIVFGKHPAETALITLGTNLPTTDLIFLSAINPTIDSFSFRATDKGASIVDPTSARLIIDSQVVPLTAGPKTVDSIDFTYKRSTPYPPNSDHPYTIEVKDTAQNPATVTGNFRTPNYVLLPASAKVTPDTTKPGFLWNMFANQANQVTSNQRTEDALAGLLKDSGGAPLPNLADPNAQGVARAPASAPSPDNAPIRFEIETVINMSQNGTDNAGNFPIDDVMPGIPATDGSDNGIAAEIITYLELPAGLITMGVNSDDGFRTTAGAIYDAFGALVLGEFDGARGFADTIFSFYVAEAGVYAFRTIWEEGGSGANIEWFTVTTNSSKVLVNDTANGGVKAYRASSTPVPTFVKAVIPPPVPRQENRVSPSLAITLSDGTTATVNDNSIVLKYDGQTVTTTKARQGKLVTVTYTPSGLLVPFDQHTADLSFADTGGAVTRNLQWSFRNLKNLLLPAPKITENFDSYPEDSQPTGWVAWNFTAQCDAGRDITVQTSESYENWVVVSVDNMILLDAGSANVAPGQTFNGQPVTSISSGNVLYAESDGRSCADALERGYDGQAQFIVSKPFDLTQVTNVLLTLSSLYTQNQDSIGAIEYSVDGGAAWLPVVYFLESPDIAYNADGTVDAVLTLTRPNADTAAWVTNSVPKGDKYGDALGAPITAALGEYIVPRVNDDQFEGARIEVFRLPAAGRKSDVRLRFAQLGTDSWWFAVDNIAFYEDPAAQIQPQPQITSAVISTGTITIQWTGGGTLQSSPSLGPTASWTPVDSDGSYSESVSGTKFFRVLR